MRSEINIRRKGALEENDTPTRLPVRKSEIDKKALANPGLVGSGRLAFRLGDQAKDATIIAIKASQNDFRRLPEILHLS